MNYRNELEQLVQIGMDIWRYRLKSFIESKYDINCKKLELKAKYIIEKLVFELNNKMQISNISEQLKESLAARVIYAYKSEGGQDEWIIQKTGEKKNGFFVDCGAAHPYIISNTWKLEKEYGWNGILVEPNDMFWALLEEYRTAKLIKKAVSNERGMFDMRRETLGSSLSKNAAQYNVGNHHEIVQVECDLLQNILMECNAPHLIDYLNLDIPGAELDVISSFDWQKYDVRLITVKNNDKTGDEYTKILEDAGYKREPNLYIDRAFSKIG